jgi:hypothetical protein
MIRVEIIPNNTKVEMKYPKANTNIAITSTVTYP